MMFMVASMAYRQPRIAFITKCARTCHHDTAQGNPVGPQWSIFAADPNVYATETAREYMKNAIFNKWESGTWVISNYTNTGVEKAGSAETKVEKPKFSICHLRDGRLSVAQSTVEVHSCGSVTTLAKLNVLVKDSDKKYHVPEFTIGSGAKTEAKPPPPKKLKTGADNDKQVTSEPKLVPLAEALAP